MVVTVKTPGLSCHRPTAISPTFYDGAKRLTQNYLKSDDDIGTSRLSFKPIVVSDSKGRYLKECANPHKNPESSILWVYKGGVTSFNRNMWLKQNIDSLITKYGNLSVYVHWDL